MEVVLTKVCTKCGVDKELGEYWKAKFGKFGRASVCKICRGKYYTKYSTANSDLIKKRRDARKSAKKEYDKLYREGNKDKIRESKKIYRDLNRESIYKKRTESGDFKRYRESNREKLVANAQKQRDKLGDIYVKKTLRQQNIPITPETIELKKEQLTVLRIKNRLKNYVKDKTSSTAK